ncbi:MAG TPA: hypothetical protein VD966_05195, partial [Pyrinomonadaceae bacterium]|nr:hypothetical protein [Pyrinomonadaceae bacterium]
MRRHILMLSEGTKRAVTRTRDWLRRIMPRVAIAAAALFILRTLLGDTRLYGEHLVGVLLELVTLIVVCFTIIYYGLKGLLWLKRHLLWRVRRRLVVTYLFVGLTPIVLLVLLGLLSAFGGSSQAMARIVTAQLNASEKQSRTSARLLADALSRLPSNIEDQSIQAWLDEWTGLLQASLPGSRVAVWRGTIGEEAATLGHDGPAR